ncbi:hypothetical protein TUBRATIS_009110 [Tubulinosema ratisbonensis]|uniref:Uncharacterized protein n=1 Tax=Tubulinosema ratisbonensis TaxID=291195 RepID=A0A437AN13_9MICR|nr:hypothetical protein TUBRATIS_009110 [Tubulinosema ratisbonensis]
MDVRTLLLIFINRTIHCKSRAQLFKVLLYKNILNHIAIKGFFGNEHQNSFYITLIKTDHFELVSFDEIFDYFIDYGSSKTIKVFKLNYHNLNSINGPQKYLTSILNIDNKEKLKIIFNEVKNSTDQIKTHFA